MNKTAKPKKLFAREITFLLLSCLMVIFFLSCKKDSGTSEIAPHPQSSQEKRFSEPDSNDNEISEPNSRPDAWQHPRSDERLRERQQMVRIIEQQYGLKNKKVLEAMLNVPRHWFVPENLKSSAYLDAPLPIGHGQTISQPFIVAYMTSLLDLTENKKVLEVGTGSGYQSAVLSEFTPHIYTIEILQPLGEAARKKLNKSGYNTVKVKIGDGYKGWPEYAVFDAIIVTCAPEDIPPALLEQLKPNGKMIIPVGGEYQIQDLILVTKDSEGNVTMKSEMPVQFVPMIRDK